MKQADKKLPTGVRTPEGTFAQGDPIFTLLGWIGKLPSASDEKNQDVINAAIGNPTYQMPSAIPQAHIEYWQKNGNKPLPYGNPSGAPQATGALSQALSIWYSFPIKATDIIPTVGGVGALNSLLLALRNAEPNGFIITTNPYYTRYAADDRLFLIDIDMRASEFRLSATLLRKSINDAKAKAGKYSTKINALLLCVPNNPLGFIIEKEEMPEIVSLLIENPDIPIILDEVYAELTESGNYYSLLHYIGEQIAKLQKKIDKSQPGEKDELRERLQKLESLKNRLYIIRSGTKAMSDAGDRSGLAIIFDPEMRQKFRKENINSAGHPPVVVQEAYAKAFRGIMQAQPEDPDFGYFFKMREHYKERMGYVKSELERLQIRVKGNEPKGAFYILADFKELIGLAMPTELQEKVFGDSVKTLQTDEHIAYYLMFKMNIVLAPLSYFGADARLGLLRITCAADLAVLKNLMGRIKEELEEVQVDKFKLLLKEIQSLNSTESKEKSADEKLEDVNFTKEKSALSIQLKALIPNEELTILFEKIKNTRKILAKRDLINDYIGKHTDLVKRLKYLFEKIENVENTLAERRLINDYLEKHLHLLKRLKSLEKAQMEKSVIKIQALYRGRREKREFQKTIEEKFQKLVDQEYDSPIDHPGQPGDESRQERAHVKRAGKDVSKRILCKFWQREINYGELERYQEGNLKGKLKCLIEALAIEQRLKEARDAKKAQTPEMSINLSPVDEPSKTPKISGDDEGELKGQEVSKGQEASSVTVVQTKEMGIISSPVASLNKTHKSSDETLDSDEEVGCCALPKYIVNFWTKAAQQLCGEIIESDIDEDSDENWNGL